MGVYVKGMKMPKNCIECPFSDHEAWCLIPGDPKMRYYCPKEEISEYCPLVEVPEPHGDLTSVQPERKTGRWLIRKGISDAQCSECKMYFSDVYDVENSDAFCRHCGAKMEGLKVVKRG